MKKELLLALLCLSLPNISHAVKIEKHEESELVLGRGVDPLTERSFEECIEYDKKPVPLDYSPIIEPGKVSSTDLKLNVEQITSYEKMNKYSSSSVSAGVSYAFVSASVSQTRTKADSMFSDEASIGLDLTANYGRYGLTNVRLKPQYAKLAQENRQEFYKQCGTEYVYGYDMGQGILVKMSVSAAASSSYSSVTTAVSAAVTTGQIGGSISGAFSKAAESLMTSSALQINMKVYGAGPLNTVSNLIKTQKDANEFKDVLAGYVKNLTPENAVITHFITQPYFPGDSNYDFLLTEVKKSTVKSLYLDFMLLLSNKERLEKSVQQEDLKTHYGPICDEHKEKCEKYINDLRAEQKWIIDKLAEIDTAAKKCMMATTIAECQTKSETNLLFQRMQRITWPKHFLYRLYKSNLDEIRDREKNKKKKG